jgi:hypothetical protein
VNFCAGAIGIRWDAFFERFYGSELKNSKLLVAFRDGYPFNLFEAGWFSGVMGRFRL